MNYAGFHKDFEIVIVTLHPFGCCSTIKICFPYRSVWKPLCCLTSLACHIVQFSRCILPASFEARSQSPIAWAFRSNSKCCLVGPRGLEPPTLRLSVARSSQLSYGPSSQQTSYPSLLAPPKAHSFRLLFLSDSNPLRWVLNRFGRWIFGGD